MPEQGEEAQPQQQQAQAQQQQPRSSNSGVAVVMRARQIGRRVARSPLPRRRERGNLAAMAAASEAATAGPAGMTGHHAPQPVAGTAATGVAALGEEMQSSLTVSGKHKDGSPRSVVSRTFSLSNLFGLASGW